jgi:hypothetical protein
MNMFAASSSLPPRFAHKLSVCISYTRFKPALLILLLGAAVAGVAQGATTTAVQTTTPTKQVRIMHPASGVANSSELRGQPERLATALENPRPLNTGSGIVYTCDPTVAAATCTYLNTTVAGYYNSTFTNANANIYITYGTTGLGESEQYYNLISYDQYVTAYNAIAGKSPVQTSAYSALGTYDATPYGSGNVEITVAIGATLGFTGLTGITSSGGACTPDTAGCYNGIITVVSDPESEGFSLYYDNLGGAEPGDAYDFYAVVEHETDEVLGTSSCVYSTGSGLTDGCDFDGGSGVPSAVDLYRYSGTGELVLDSSLSETVGAYFSYDGGTTNGAKGLAGSPKFYNTLDNEADYADFAFVSDCGTNESIQDAFGCPGADGGLTILNDGRAEINILNAVGFSMASGAPALTSPTPGSVLGTTDVVFSWTSGTGVTEYDLYLGTTAGSANLYNSAGVTTTSVTVPTLPALGATVYAQLYYKVSGVWQSTAYTYTESPIATPALTSPTPTSVLGSTNVVFSWTPGGGVSEYDLYLGTGSAGSTNLYNSAGVTTTSVAVAKIPALGATVYARLSYLIKGVWGHTDYTYTESPIANPALTSPTPGSVLGSTNVVFSWTPGGGVSEYDLYLGTGSAGSTNLYNSAGVTTTSVAVAKIPALGATVYARLSYLIKGVWGHTDYTYTESPIANPALTSPTPGSVLGTSGVVFSWTPGGGVSEYDLYLGATTGSANIYNSGGVTTTSVTVPTLPSKGVTVYARLYYQIKGVWQFIDYTYTEQ